MWQWFKRNFLPTKEDGLPRRVRSLGGFIATLSVAGIAWYTILVRGIPACPPLPPAEPSAGYGTVVTWRWERGCALDDP